MYQAYISITMAWEWFGVPIGDYWWGLQKVFFWIRVFVMTTKWLCNIIRLNPSHFISVLILKLQIVCTLLALARLGQKSLSWRVALVTNSCPACICLSLLFFDRPLGTYWKCLFDVVCHLLVILLIITFLFFFFFFFFFFFSFFFFFFFSFFFFLFFFFFFLFFFFFFFFFFSFFFFFCSIFLDCYIRINR